MKDEMPSLKEILKSEKFQKELPEGMTFSFPKVLREIERGERQPNRQQKGDKKKNAA